jgi:hypothetical protein
VSTPAYFAQVLEGPAEEVDRVLARIERDPRHHDVRLLRTSTIVTRDFPRWVMGSVVPADEQQTDAVAVAISRAYSVGEESTADAVMSVLHSALVSSQIW